MGSNSKYRWVQGIAVLLASFVSFLILFKLNYLQIDLAGHMASAKSLLQVGYHGYQDQFFHGYVQNLFYPPLEDFILAFLYLITGDSYELSVKVYLLFLTWGFLLSLMTLVKGLKRDSAKAFLLITFLLLLSLNKPGLMFFQGLSYFDLLVTGLSSQFLSGIFFFLLLREILGKARPQILGSLLFALILSHIIMGLVGVLLIGFWWLRDRSYRSLAVLSGWVLATSFFSVPFLLSKNYLVSSNILGPSLLHWCLFTILGLVLFWKNSSARFLFLVALFLFLPSTLGQEAKLCFPHPDSSVANQCFQFWKGISLPAFHYYRLAMPALYLILTALGLVLDAFTAKQSKKEKTRFALYLSVGILFFFWGNNFKPLTHFDDLRFESSRVDFSQSDWPSEPPNELTRLWTIDLFRSIDFGMDSYLFLNEKGYFFSKGLFWESSRNNLLLTSYLATLLGPPTILDYYYFYGYDCESLNCFVDMFARDEGLGFISYPKDPPYYLTSQLKKCYASLFDSGTTRLSFKKEADFKVSGRGFSLFKIQNRNSEQLARPLDLVSSKDLIFYEQNKPLFFHDLFDSYFQGCVTHKTPSTSVFLRKDTSEELQIALRSYTAEPKGTESPRFERVLSGHYRIHLNQAEMPNLFRIKLSYFPGLTLKDEKGTALPFAEGLSGIVGLGTGKMILQYQRPRFFYFCYLLSGFFLLLLGSVQFITSRSLRRG